MNKEQFEEYLQKKIEEIKEEYLKFVRDEDKIYLTLTIIKEKNDDEITFDFHNNYWELPSSQQIQIYIWNKLNNKIIKERKIKWQEQKKVERKQH